MSLSDRQEKLLKAIVNEFIETAEAVGSINLIENEKYDFKVSSATIRNEMAELVIRGYLYKKHSSGGRIPTTKGWKFFVDKVKKEINYIDANAGFNTIGMDKDDTETGISTLKSDTNTMIRQGLSFLSTLSENAAVALIDNNLFYSGLANLTKLPEMQDSENLKKILRILEDYYTLTEVFDSKKDENEDINILIGEEDTGKEIFENYSIIFAELSFSDGRKGFLSVIGPNRMDYKKIISGMKYISQTFKHLVNNESN